MLRSSENESCCLSPLSRILREHLAGNDEESIAFVEAGAHYLTLRPGEVLLRQGDRGDDVYFVLSGRMRAETIGEAGAVLGEIGRGESVGELAIFTGEVRSATITALRQTKLARIPRQLIDRAIALRPELALQLTRRVVARFRTQDEIRPAPIVPRTLCIVPITPGVDAQAFAFALAAGQPGRVAVLDAASVGHRVGEALGGLIDGLEGDHAAIYLVADPEDFAWTRACLQNADEILLLADAEADPRLSVIEMQLLAGPCAVTVARRSLILLHDTQTATPRGTARWVALRGRPRHFHIRPKLASDMARLGRVVSGRANGLVLAGGGARGFAHIGVYQALEELGVPVDFVGGTSIGALMGTPMALDVRGVEMERGVREGFFGHRGRNITGDFNLLPILSLLKGKRSQDSLVRSVHGFAGSNIDMEDTWKPFFVIATNFSYGREEVLRHGPLVPAVTASFAIPGAFPPVLIGDSLLFDGSTFNNLPLDVMARQGVGMIIGVDLGGELARPLDIPNIPGPLALLADRLRPKARQIYGRLPTLPETMLTSTFITSMSRQREQRRYADLLFRPPLPAMGLLDWNRFDELVAAGRAHAMDVLRRQDPLLKDIGT